MGSQNSLSKEKRNLCIISNFLNKLSTRVRFWKFEELEEALFIKHIVQYANPPSPHHTHMKKKRELQEEPDGMVFSSFLK